MSQLLDRPQAKEVLAFSEEHGLGEKLQLAIERMTQAFPDAQQVKVSVEGSPESDHRWILIDVVVAGSAKEIHQRHAKCDNDLGLVIGWPANCLIHTTYSLA